MEPIAAQNAAGILRPAHSATEVGAVLREGQVLAGKILQSLGDGSVLLSVAGHRVPAQTNIDLQPGQSFFARVELENGLLLLRLLGSDAAAQEPSLLGALRQVVGQERPLGELLLDVAERLRAEAGTAGAGREPLGKLLSSLAAHTHDPNAGGAAGGLQELLSRSGLRYEAALLAAVTGKLGAEGFEMLRADLKAELLQALIDLPAGPARQAVVDALAGLEAEQLLNLARQQAGEPQLWSFPVPDGGGWTSAMLELPAKQEGEEGEDQEGGNASLRMALGVNFSQLGPVRADVTLNERVLAVRLLTGRPDTAARLREDAARLSGLLDDGERELRLVIRAGTPEEVAVGARPLDTHFLRNHRLMDVQG
jgi:hypothetical protein